jgi:hypothetical protein
MPEHLTGEQIAAMLDGPETVDGGPEHLEACPACAREYEQMSRLRMALSGLPDLEPPAGEWDRIRTALGPRAGGSEEGVDGDRMSDAPLRAASPAPPRRRRIPSWPILRAAAVLLLFAGSLWVAHGLVPGADDRGAEGADERPAGGQLADAQDVAPGAGASRDAAGQAAPAAEAYLQTVAGLQRLREHDPSDPSVDDAETVAARITHLDALIEASQEALKEAPGDPALNNFLFDVVDERDALAGQLDRTLRFASVEY